MLELWGRPNAYNVIKALWLLAELGLEFRHHDVGSNEGDLDTPEFAALNPMRRVPVLRDGDAVVWESHTLLRYLANRFDDGTLYPREPLPRSQVERWMDWAQTSLQPAFMDLFWGFYRMPAEQRDHAAIDAALLRCREAFEILDCRLGDAPYLAGEAFTLADITSGVSLYRYFNLGKPVDEPPRVMDWYGRLQQRAAFRQAVMQPFGELAGRVQY